MFSTRLHRGRLGNNMGIDTGGVLTVMCNEELERLVLMHYSFSGALTSCPVSCDDRGCHKLFGTLTLLCYAYVTGGKAL
jgi:hypothetical protein